MHMEVKFDELQPKLIHNIFRTHKFMQRLEPKIKQYKFTTTYYLNMQPSLVLEHNVALTSIKSFEVGFMIFS